MRDKKRLVNPITVTLSLTFLFFYYFGHKIKFLGQNKNIVCDTKTVNNTFNMSTDGGAGSNGQQTSIHIMHLFQGGKKIAAPSVMEGVQCNQLATRWLAGPPGECCHIGNSALLSAIDMLTCWTLSSSSQISFGEEKSMLLS